MSLESQIHQSEGHEPFDLTFETRTYHEGKKVVYIFNHVVVMIDTTGRNVDFMPEIMFGTFENRDTLEEHNVLRKPVSRVEGVSMPYVVACIEKVARTTGISDFWFAPYNGDTVKREGVEVDRAEARLRLFEKYLPILPGPEGYGYIIHFDV